MVPLVSDWIPTLLMARIIASPRPMLGCPLRVSVLFMPTVPGLGAYFDRLVAWPRCAAPEVRSLAGHYARASGRASVPKSSPPAFAKPLIPNLAKRFSRSTMRDARDRIRTCVAFRPEDFKSPASTNSATRAGW
jgi:hypothetical protein